MLEVYLFVNPLGSMCMSSEQDILRLASRLPDDGISYQFIPLLNQTVIDHLMTSRCVEDTGLDARNRLFQMVYNVVLDYKASLFQGKKKGRQFLIAMQDAMVTNKLDYSRQLGTEIAQQVGIDLEMFEEDRRSDLAKQAFQADQKLAAEMSVEAPPTAVIFNTADSDYGVMIPKVNYASLCAVVEEEGVATKAQLVEQSAGEVYRAQPVHQNKRLRLL